MDRYLIRDTNNGMFLSKITVKGIETTLFLQEAIIIEDDLDRAEQLLKYIDNEDYVIEEIEFRTVDLEKE